MVRRCVMVVGMVGGSMHYMCGDGAMAPLPVVVHNNQASVVHIYLGPGTQVNHQATALSSAGSVPAAQQLAAHVQKDSQGWWQRIKCFIGGMKPAWEINILHTRPSWWRYVREHSWSLAWRSALMFYVVLNYRIFLLQSYLRSPDRWIAWKQWSSHILMQSDTANTVHDLIATVRIRDGIVSSICSDAEIVQRIIKEVDTELRAIDTYFFYVDTIRWVNDVQQYGALLCEGYVPSVGGIPWGSIFRMIIQKASLGSLVYIDRRLVEEVSGVRYRLIHLRELLQCVP